MVSTKTRVRPSIISPLPWLPVLLVISLLSPTGTVRAAGGGQIVGCTFAALQAALRAGGNWFYAAHQCPNPILFTGTITMGRNTTLIAQGQDITRSGGGKRRLFHVTGGVLALTGITIGDGHAKASDGDGGAIVIYPHAGLTLDHCVITAQAPARTPNRPAARAISAATEAQSSITAAA
jgi:hypothetical protein